MRSGSQRPLPVVKDGKNEDETILIVESNGALTAEEILLAVESGSLQRSRASNS